MRRLETRDWCCQSLGGSRERPCPQIAEGRREEECHSIMSGRSLIHEQLLKQKKCYRNYAQKFVLGASGE